MQTIPVFKIYHESENVEDFPIKTLPLDIPNWSENYALAGYDPVSNISIFFHIGRWRLDVTQWREIMTIALPDGSVLAHRAVGDAHASENGPGGPNLQVTVTRNHQAQNWKFHGGARRVAESELARNILSDGTLTKVDFELKFASDMPIWDLGTSGHQTDFAGHGHVEQIGRTVGAIQVGKESYPFDAMLNRDHSRGPRVVDQLNRHVWMNGVFENGICFYAYLVHQGDEMTARMSRAAVFDKGVLHEGELQIDLILPDHNPTASTRLPVRFEIAYDGKKLAGIISDFKHTLTYQFTAPYDTYIGARQIDDVPNRYMIEQGVLLSLDSGVAGSGHIERTVPGKILLDERLA